MNEGLPSYRHPPVIEVVAGVQFESLSAAHIAHFGLLWQQYRHDFPRVEAHPPLAPAIERLGVRIPVGRAQIEVTNDFSSSRVWFLTDSGDELIQVQSDRFIRNWRAVPSLANPYPRYRSHIRPCFERDFDLFEVFVRSEHLGELKVNQCEVTYVNHIRPNRIWSTHEELSRVFRLVRPEYKDLMGRPIDAAMFRTVHLLNSPTGDFLGRLHIQIQSAFRNPGDGAVTEEPIFILTLTARGRPVSEGVTGVMEFMDLGRSAIVDAFDKITTPKMHEVWGKQT